MDNDLDQLGLFPPDDDSPEGSRGRNVLARRLLAPGDWLSIEHEGRTVVGMIYRRRKDTYSFVYWDNLVLRFGTTTRDRIGPWDEELTAIFRGQIAVIPNYVERCIAGWVMLPSQPARMRRKKAPRRSTRSQRPEVQLRLFPE